MEGGTSREPGYCAHTVPADGEFDVANWDTRTAYDRRIAAEQEAAARQAADRDAVARAVLDRTR